MEAGMRRRVVVIAGGRDAAAALTAAVHGVGGDGVIEVVRLLDGAEVPEDAARRAAVIAGERARLDRIVDAAERAFPRVRVASRVLLGDPRTLLSRLRSTAEVRSG